MLKRLTNLSIFLIGLLVLSISVSGVAEANNAPTTNGTIPAQTVNIGGTATTVDVSSYFSDADGDTLTYTATSSDTAKATVSVSSATVTITAVAAGTATITVTATDPGGLSVQQTISVTVVQPNRAPTASTIPTQDTHLDGSPTTLDVSSYFTDADGDTLTYTATSADTSKVTVSVSGSTLTMTPVAAWQTTITVTATDPDGLTGSQTFTVNVLPPVPDQALKVGGGSITIDTLAYFGVSRGTLFVFSAKSSNTAVVSISTPHLPTFGNSANIVLNPVGAGTATITAKLTIGNHTRVEIFNVTVYDGPIAVGTIPDITFTSNGSSSNVDLSSYFGAFDMSGLTWTVVSSDTAKATVSLSGTTLTVTSVAPGTSTITARATDSANKSATQTFTVTVKGAPVPTGTIPDQTLEIGGAAVTINVSGYFTDPDGGALTYTANLLGSVRITFSLAGSILTIQPTQNASTGSGTLRIRATDPDNLSAIQEFTVTLTPANRAPVASGTIPDVTTRVGRSATDVDLSGYFTDADADTLTYTVISSNTAKATVSLSNATLSVTPVAVGTATITVTATDPHGAFATQTFTMTVNQANRAPVASKTIPHQKIKRVYAPNSSSAIVALADYFSDPDGDALTYTAPTADTTGIVTLNFSRGPSTLEIFPLLAGTTGNSGTGTITVTATDGDNASVSQTFSVSTSIPPVTVGTISDQYLSGEPTSVANIQNYFSDADGDTLTYSASSSDTSIMTTSLSGTTVTLSEAGGQGAVTATITATDPIGSTATQTLTVYVNVMPPTAVGTIPNISGAVNQAGTTITLSGYFSDPAGQTLTYSASSSDTYVVSVSINSSNGLEVTPQTAGTATITVTATNPYNLSATQSISVKLTESVFVGEADAIPSLNSEELLQLGALLTYDTLIFNELHNGSDDAADWLELRNVSGADILLDGWQLTIRTGEADVVIDLPADTVVPVGEVLLLVNTEMATADASVSSVVAETFVLPQEDFALILRSPTAFGDLAGNYFQDEKERPETAPELTVDTVWERTQPIIFGYRAEAWVASPSQDGLGTPGYIAEPAEDTARQVSITPVAAPEDSDYTFERIEVEGVQFLALTASSDFEDYAGYTQLADGEKEVAFTIIDGVFTT